MKKRRLSVLIVVLILVVSACALACDDEDKGYVVITFVTNFEGLVIEPIILDGVEEKFMPEDPVRAGYDFGGWYYDQVFGVRFSTGDEITQDTTLYAKWIRKSGGETPDVPRPEDPKGFVYLEEGETYTVTGYRGTSAEIVVPARYNSRPVTKIQAGAFAGNANLTKISFGLNISDVGEGAFRNCPSLTDIVVENGNYYYLSDGGLLYNAQKTTLITAPAGSGITELLFDKKTVHIMDYALENCVFAVAFRPDSEYTAIDGYDFAGFGGRLTVGRNITEIRQYAFKDAECEIAFSADCTISSLSTGAFDSYAGERLVLPGTVRNIYSHAFSGCTAAVDISRTAITAIGERAFAGYAGEAFNVPLRVTQIEKNAFYDSRTTISFAANSAYATVGEQAFGGFHGAVTLPAAVTTINKNAFYGAGAEVTFASGGSYAEVAENAFNYFRGSLTLPASVAGVQSNAFYGASGKVFFAPDSRYSVVEEKAFCGFNGEVTFPSGVTDVRKDAFFKANGDVNFTVEEGQIRFADGALNEFNGKLIYPKKS